MTANGRPPSPGGVPGDEDHPASGSTPQPLRVAVVDNDAMAALGLKMVFEAVPGWDVAWMATSGREAIERCRQAPPPQVLLVDLEMPEMDGPAIARAARRRIPGIGILFVTAYASQRSVLRAAATGAQGIAFKDDSAASLRAWAESAARGEATGREAGPFPSVAEASLSIAGIPAGTSTSSKPTSGLTAREVEILRLYSSGHTTEQVAERLALGRAAVQADADRAMAKLGAASRTQGIAEAIRWGLI